MSNIETPVREIIFDTETTGFEPGLSKDGHRMIEIGCVEVVNMIPTGRTFHKYVQPERDVPADAIAVHGITDEQLVGKPLFSGIVEEFLDFIGDDSKLVAHNASFDMKFLNWELKHAGFPSLDKRRVIDTLFIARQKFPGSPASLDALCRRFSIDNSNRTFHGALLDAELLTNVYVELLGGRQHGFDLSDLDKAKRAGQNSILAKDQKRAYRAPRPFPPTAEELLGHEKLLEQIGDSVWKAR